MTFTTKSRVQNLENRLLKRECKTCWNTGSVLLHIPPGEDKTSPEWNPTHCAECARPLKLVRHVIGVSQETAAQLLRRSDREAS